MFPVAHFMALCALSSQLISAAALPMPEVPGIPALLWRTRVHVHIPEIADLPFASPRLEFTTDVQCLSHGWGALHIHPFPGADPN
ncbi:hypothetical protein C8R45DRAFT_1128996 [Mycena sanguinolenta]|nr:hypothetical protein C8R45DRAFT_1128996 [Mycena sanguinolenta]